MSDSVLLETTEGVAAVTLNRPESLNSLDTATKEALRDTLQKVAADPAVRAVVLTGSGKGFCVGQDLRELTQQAADGLTVEQIYETVPKHYAPICMALATMPKPVIAGVNGVAAGAGASMAFACDFRIGSDTARFNLAFTAIGLSPDTGASWTLPRLVGRQKALELLMMPETISAGQALELGLLTRLVPAAEYDDTLREFAARLASGPTVAYGAVRQLLDFAATGSLADTLKLEGELIAKSGGTEDHANAVMAFLSKQQPEFKGR
jgi:2-(1,2-epoxy-1,2-dihydrophenyl)acetyl-CoA isomerase